MNIREMIEEAKKPVSEEEREAARVRWAEAPYQVCTESRRPEDNKRLA